MSVVDLPFLPLGQHMMSFSLKGYYNSLSGQRGSHTLRRVRWCRVEAKLIELTVCDLYKLTLRVWLAILVGVVFTTETFVRLLYVLFRCRSVHCLTKPKSSILFVSVATCVTHNRELCIGLLH